MKVIRAIKERVNYEVRIVKKIEKYLTLYKKKGRISKIRARWLFNRVKQKNSCNIYPKATFGDNIYIAHPNDIIIGETAVLGNNIMIYPSVYIVSNFTRFETIKSGRRHAKVGDNCILCARSMLVGNIEIGNNCIIAAGAIVTKNVPDNSIVTGTNEIRSNKYDNINFIKRNKNNGKSMFVKG